MAVTALTFNADAEQLLSGGLDNDIKVGWLAQRCRLTGAQVWEMRKLAVAYKLYGHTGGTAAVPRPSHPSQTR